MFETTSLFDALELDDTDRRVAQRRALALAQTRVENRMGSFLRGAQSEEEFLERLALLQEDFSGAVRTASIEVGYDKPEHVEESIKAHYAAAVNFEETPTEEEEDEDAEKRSKAASANSDSTPRVASEKVGEWLLEPHTAALGDVFPDPHASQTCPNCNTVLDPRAALSGRCSHCGAPTAGAAKSPTLQDRIQGQQYPIDAVASTTAAKHHMDGVTDKEDRQYEHIKENYLEDGKSEEEAKELAARTVNKQKGSSTSFLAGSWTVTADGGNTGLGGPEPKIDKSHTPLTGPPAGAEPDKKIDPMVPEIAKNRTEDDLDELGDIKKESLPAASGDDSGFSTETPGGKGDHTKVFPKGDQTNPVTRETISSSEFPSPEAVRAALTR